MTPIRYQPSDIMTPSEPFDIPEMFICPLTLELMEVPMMTRWGHNFERDAIMRWMERHDQCPLTRNPISLKDIIVNRALKERIQAWKQSHNSNNLQENGLNNEIVVNDQTLPFLVQVNSTKVMIRALQDAKDPSAQSALKQLKLKRKEEKTRRRIQRAAEAA